MSASDDRVAEPGTVHASGAGEVAHGRASTSPAAAPISSASVEEPINAEVSNANARLDEKHDARHVDDPLMSLPPELYDPGPPATDSRPRLPMEAISPAESDPGPPTTAPQGPVSVRPDSG